MIKNNTPPTKITGTFCVINDNQLNVETTVGFLIVNFWVSRAVPFATLSMYSSLASSIVSNSFQEIIALNVFAS